MVTPLPNGNAMLTHYKDCEEEGEDLRIYFWQITNYVHPKHVRVAAFSYTILAGQENEPTIANELEIIREQIPKATFALELGK